VSSAILYTNMIFWSYYPIKSNEVHIIYTNILNNWLLPIIVYYICLVVWNEMKLMLFKVNIKCKSITIYHKYECGNVFSIHDF